MKNKLIYVLIIIILNSCQSQSHLEDVVQKALEDFYQGYWTTLLQLANKEIMNNFPPILLDEVAFNMEKDYITKFLEKRVIEKNIYELTFLINQDTLKLNAKNNNNGNICIELTENKMIEMLKKEHKIRYSVSKYLQKENQFYLATIWLSGAYYKQIEWDSAGIDNLNRIDRNIYYKSIGKTDELLQIYKEEAANGYIGAMLELGDAYDAYQPFYTYPKDYKEGEALKWYFDGSTKK